MTKLQHFGWFLARGFGPHGWGHPYLDWNYRWTNPDLYQESARALEQAGFDLVPLVRQVAASVSTDRVRMARRRLERLAQVGRQHLDRRP